MTSTCTAVCVYVYVPGFARHSYLTSHRIYLADELCMDFKLWQQYVETYENVVCKFEMASTHITEVITHHSCSYLMCVEGKSHIAC